MKKSKVLVMTLCAVLLVATTVLGTMAYLTSEASVVNTFTVGKVEITLDEKDVDNDNNTADNVTVNGVVRDKANTYHLIPGKTYTKDPTIHVDADSEDCYLFVKVENGIAAIEDATTVADQMTAKGWIAVDGVDNVYVYTNGQTDPVSVTAGGDVTVFESFKVKGAVTNAEIAAYSGKEITVTAYAVQKDGFETFAAKDIWTATFGAPATPDP